MESIYHHIVSAAIATAVAEVTTIPLYTLKTNFQNTTADNIRQAFQSIWKSHGIKGFYNASGWAIGSQVLSTSSKYTLYRYLQPYTPNNFVAGCLGGILTSLMTHPIDVVKIHSQMHTPFLPELNKVGPSIFYRGYSKSFSKSAVGSLFYYPLYDLFNTQLHNPTQAAILSAISSTIILQPFDYLKTRHVYNQQFHYTQLFRGLILNLFRVVPHFTITMVLIDHFKSRLMPVDELLE